MRTATRLGLAAAAIAGSAALPGTASAAYGCYGAVTYPPSLPVQGAAVCYNTAFPVKVYDHGPTLGGKIVCYMGYENVQVWVNGWQALRPVQPGMICTPVI